MDYRLLARLWILREKAKGTTLVVLISAVGVAVPFIFWMGGFYSVWNDTRIP